MQGGTFMHKQYTYMDADWNNLEVLQRNRLKTRPFLCGFSNLDEAYRKETANLQSLNGKPHSNWRID